MMVNRDNVFRVLQDLDSARALRSLFVRELGYDPDGDVISSDDWPEDVASALAESPTLLASTAREGRFTIVHARLLTAGKLSLISERKIMERLRHRYPFSLFVFSDAEDRLWHFVNAPHIAREAGDGSVSIPVRKQYRRIVVGNNGLRTATERLSMLSVDDLAERSGKEGDELSPLEVQAAHDKAFDVESVTKKFFDTYREVFVRVESLIEGIADPERKRLFTQRLFNRLMFLAFIQKKGWLKFGDSQDYLPALFQAYRGDEYDDNFYRDRLKHLFFAGLNTPHGVDIIGINEGGYLREVIGDVPYLNGGLFEKDEDDRDDVVVPDEAIALILQNLFAHFNFTITESTPLDVEVAVDPEMLGRVFEELVTGRHETGSYYTPKPIVSFMCREALKGHLEARLPQDSSEAVRQFVEEQDSSDLRDPEGTLEALRSVRVCDPACGSGAYLLGMLHELLDLRASLFATRSLDPISNYDRKLEIIQRNLYGVDIDPFAVNIARLRLWLSLVVEFEGEENQKPPPLPNLDFKIEVGDSLSAPDPSGGFELDMVRDEQVARLEGLKADFLKAHGEEKKRLRDEVDALRLEIAAWAHPGGNVSGFDWQVEFAEVFAHGVDPMDGAGGFEVILANPPYVRMELFKEIKPTLRKNLPEVHSDRADLYVYFYGRALQLLRSGGMLAFISSNKWFRAGYGKKLRKLMADTTHVTSITDFGDLPVFESATAYPMIFTAQKERNRNGVTAFTQAKTLDPPYPDVAALVGEQGHSLPSDALNGSDWSLTDESTSSRLRKMRASGVPLGEYVRGQIYYGVKTGLNQAFVIDGATRAELISHDPGSAIFIKPFLTGKNIRKWDADSKDKWLLYMHHGVKVSKVSGVLEYLEPYRDQLEGRATKQEWYELQQPQVRYATAFEKPKIVFPDIAKKPRFALDHTGAYSGDTTFLIPVEDLYLLGLLNSSAVEDFFIQVGATVRGGYLRFKRQYVEQIPVPDARAHEREAIARLAQECLDAKGVGCEKWEQEIDERAAALYGLPGGL